MPDLDLFASENVNANEHNSFPVTVNEPVAVVEVCSCEFASLDLSVFESVSASEDTGGTNPNPLFLTATADVVTASDISAALLDDGTLIVLDFVSVQEVVVAGTEINVSVFEALTVTEFAAATDAIRFTGTLSDDLTITEFAAATIALNLLLPPIDFLHELLTVQEFAAAIIGRAASASTTVTTTESVQLGLDPNPLSVQDTITTQEAPNLGFELFDLPLVFDGISLFEVPTLETGIDLGFNDFQRSYPFEEHIITNVLVEVFENGTEQRRDKWGRVKRGFHLVFAPRLKIEIDPIKTFYIQHRGPGTQFNFKNPLDDVVYTVRFLDGTFSTRRVGFDLFQAEADVVEVF